MLGTAIALMTATGATAALPIKSGRYIGKTSQGLRITLAVTKSGSSFDTLIARVALSCPRLGRLAEDADASFLDMRRNGRFGSVAIGGIQTGETVIVDGARRELFQLDRTELSGAFTSRTRAAGTLRLRRVYYDLASEFDRDTTVDRCDTGVVTWAAALTRRS
jgi:hypothetical protein